MPLCGIATTVQIAPTVTRPHDAEIYLNARTYYYLHIPFITIYMYFFRIVTRSLLSANYQTEYIWLDFMVYNHIEFEASITFLLNNSLVYCIAGNGSETLVNARSCQM